MKKRIDSSVHPDQHENAPHRVRLPKFITDEEIGLGDVIKRTTSYSWNTTLRRLWTPSGCA